MKKSKISKSILNNITFLKEVLPELLKEKYCKENGFLYIKPKQKEITRKPIDQKYYFS